MGGGDIFPPRIFKEEEEEIYVRIDCVRLFRSEPRTDRWPPAAVRRGEKMRNRGS